MHVFKFTILIASLSALSVSAQSIGDLTERFATPQPISVQSAAKLKSTTFSVQDAQGFFNGFVLKGVASGDYRRGFVRFLEDAGWTEWAPLRYLDVDTAPYFYAGFRGDVYREGQLFELRFDTDLLDNIEITELGVFDNRDDADARATIEAPALELPQIQSAVIPPHLIPRSEWNASPFVGTPVPLAQPSYTRMTFHHAAGFSAFSYEEGKAQVKAIQDFHQNVRGWSDIGYQFVFDQQGRLYQGRPFLDNRVNLNSAPVLAQGAHVGGANTGNIGVSLLGCYHPPESANCVDVASPALIDSVVTLYAYLSEQYRVDAANLLGHRDQSATACPGDNNYVLLPEIRNRIRELILTGNEPIASASLDAQADDTGVVRLSWAFSEIVDVTSYRIERSTTSDTTVIFESTNLEALQAVDATVPGGGGYEYHLFAVSSTGREQRLSSAGILITSPQDFSLSENFPNPYAGSTNIRYYLEHEGLVHLNVYDASGRLIDTLVDEFQDGDQWYVAPFNSAGLASGAYFYRLRVEGFSDIVFDETRSMQIVR